MATSLATNVILTALLILNFQLLIADQSLGLAQNQDFSSKNRSLEQQPLAESDNELRFSRVDKIEDFCYNGSRLPNDVTPISYDLDLRVDIDRMRFEGKVEIIVNSTRAVSYVVLHAKDLDIQEANITQRNLSKAGAELGSEDTEVPIVVISTVVYEDQLCVKLNKELEPEQDYVIELRFTGNISSSLDGLYKSTYKTSEEQERSMVLTHFEPAHAREVFPCFDEPALKANFTLSIAHDKSYTSLSNMPLDRTVVLSDGSIQDLFQTSVKMSTYLVSFVVFDFQYVEKYTDSGIKVRVYAPPDDQAKLGLALSAAVDILSYFEELFNVPFALPKLDLIAVPDFLHGAMENWGLITFRRSYIVYDEHLMTTDTKQKIVSVIAHEIAHQWFGDIVTMEWWNDLWLNEGFANFAEFIGTDHAYPKWKYLDNAVTNCWKPAMEFDSVEDTHPVSAPVQKPQQIDELFDFVSYQKGASVLRMLLDVLGDQTFWHGIEKYLKDHLYGNATTRQLWQAMTAESGQPIESAMKGWIQYKSFPVVTVRMDEDGERHIISQQSYLARHSKYNETRNASNDYSTNVWSIPITYTVYTTQAIKPNTTLLWLNEKRQKRTLLSSEGWLKMNINSSGYYVVNYDTDNWRKVVDQLSQELLDPLLALNLSTYLTSENHLIPWRMARSSTKCIIGMIDKPKQHLYRKYLFYLQSHLINYLGLEDIGDDSQRVMRMEVLSEIMRSGERTDINRKFQDIFTQLKSGNRTSANYRYLAFHFGVNKTNPDDWDYLWSVYQSSPVDTDRAILLHVLPSFQTDELRMRNLQYALDKSKIRPQDALYWIEKVDKGKKDVRWTFITQNWDTLYERYHGNYKLANLFIAVAVTFTTSEQLKEVEEFFATKSTDEISKRTRTYVLNKIRSSINKETPEASELGQHNEITKWLENFMKNKT